MLQKTKGATRNGHSRDTGNIGHTIHRAKTLQRNWQHWTHKTQGEDTPEKLATLGTQNTGRRHSRDTGNIGHTRHRAKTLQRHWQHWAHKTQGEDTPETLATLGTQDTGRSKQKTKTNKQTIIQTKHTHTQHRKLKRWAIRTHQKCKGEHRFNHCYVCSRL
jgi:hypothetical protein